VALPIIPAQRPVVNTGSVGMRLCGGGVGGSGGSGGGLYMPDGMPVTHHAYVLFACDRKD